MSAPAVARAFAPATSANLAVGFDILGQALAGIGDTVTARRVPGGGVSIRAVHGGPQLPLAPEHNTAGAAVLSLLREHPQSFGVELEISKGIPLGSGLGGSAASAVAALVAANALLPGPLPREALYPHALAGEAVASGSAHGDNVGPALLGGLVLAAGGRLLPLPTPGWWTLVVHPDTVLETRRARAALQAPYPLAQVTGAGERLALVLCGLHRHDPELVRLGLRDELVEPRRAELIPGFAGAKAALLSGGALGASISGAGPSVFGWFVDAAAARAAAPAVGAAFAAAGLGSRAHLSPFAAPGARLLDQEEA